MSLLVLGRLLFGSLPVRKQRPIANALKRAGTRPFSAPPSPASNVIPVCCQPFPAGIPQSIHYHSPGFSRTTAVGGKIPGGRARFLPPTFPWPPTLSPPLPHPPCFARFFASATTTRQSRAEYLARPDAWINNQESAAQLATRFSRSAEFFQHRVSICRASRICPVFAGIQRVPRLK